MNTDNCKQAATDLVTRDAACVRDVPTCVNAYSAIVQGCDRVDMRQCLDDMEQLSRRTKNTSQAFLSQLRGVCQTATSAHPHGAQQTDQDQLNPYPNVPLNLRATYGNIY